MILLQLFILSSSLWGSYMIIASFSYFLGGILQYIIINVIRRASVPEYASAHLVTPFRVIGKELFLFIKKSIHSSVCPSVIYKHLTACNSDVTASYNATFFPLRLTPYFVSKFYAKAVFTYLKVLLEWSS